MLSLSFIKEIEKIIGRENVLTGEADRQNYAYDAAVLPPVDSGPCRPSHTHVDQLGPLIQKCYYEEGIPITIRGSGHEPERRDHPRQYRRCHYPDQRAWTGFSKSMTEEMYASGCSPA